MADHGQPQTYRLPLPRHPPTDSPCITRGRSASASPMRVMRAETWRHIPPRGRTRQPDPLTPGSLLPAFSLPPSLPSLSLSSPKPWRSSTLSPPLKPLHLTGASPEDAEERHRRAAPPRSPLLPWGGASPTSFFFYFIPSLKLQARKTTPSFPKPSPSPWSPRRYSTRRR